MSFQVSLEICQGLSIPERGGKFIPPARNGEWKRSGKWFCASLWWYPEASLTCRLLRGCRLSSVSGSRQVLSLWLFYMQASVSWTWCELQPGASAGRQREVWHGPFWVRWRPIMLQHSESSVKVVHDGSPARRALQSRNDKGLDKKLCNVLCKEAPDLSDVVQCKPAGLSSFWNVVFESEPKIRTSKITPRFLTELDGVIVDESIWMVKSCCRVGVAGKTRSSVFPRLSCRWCSFSHAEMSARQPEIRADTVGSSGQNER